METREKTKQRRKGNKEETDAAKFLKSYTRERDKNRNREQGNKNSIPPKKKIEKTSDSSDKTKTAQLRKKKEREKIDTASIIPHVHALNAIPRTQKPYPFASRERETQKGRERGRERRVAD